MDSFLDRAATTVLESESLGLRLSQGHLNLLATCPRKFQHIFLDQLSAPPPPEQQERQVWGSRFHLLMQQRQLGLPIESLVQADDQLQQCFAGLIAIAPHLLDAASSSDLVERSSEHRRTCSSYGYPLTVIYDLLSLEPHQAQIVDWKTYPRPRDRQHLAPDWQTRLYPYVLAETSDYSPEQITMLYWFVQARDPNNGQLAPQCLTFHYDSDLHEQTRQDLRQLLNQLTVWLEDYHQGIPFPQVNPSIGACPTCHFSGRCQRSLGDRNPNFAEPGLSDIAAIDEVEL
jgi:hypothetical protein